MKNTTSRGRVSQAHSTGLQSRVLQTDNTSSQIHKAVAGKTPSKVANTAKATNAISKTPSISKALKALVFSAFALNFAAAVELNTICTGGGDL